MQYILKEFGNPQEKLKIIHVAGTNGKGSICEMLSNILVNTEYKVGKFISPHLIKFNDGIYINNKQISDEEVKQILIPLSKIIEKYNKTHTIPVKWFEVITSLVLIFFAKNNCDLVILETGLGGTTDCTNVVNSMVSIIANIGLDHIDILGDTIESIATHKAGIIKENSETVFVEQIDSVNAIIQKKCKEKHTKLHLIKKDSIKNYNIEEELQTFDYKNYKNIQINLKGKVQTSNAAEVLECIDILKSKGFVIPDEAIYKGLKTVVHRARFEIINKNPLIIFDGAHNEAAINNLKENIQTYYSKIKKVYVVSLLKTKDYKKIVQKLSEDKEGVFYFTSGNDKNRYVSKEDLYMEASKYLNHSIYKEDLKKTIEIVTKDYKDRVIFIVGSFYVYKTVVKTIR